MEAGGGPPALLLHGFPETWYAWRKQILALSARYRLIIPDLRGYGEMDLRPVSLTPEALGFYVRAYQKPGAIRSAVSDYRAGREDVAQDQADADTAIACPTLALWGQDFELAGKMWDMAGIWRKMATNLRTVSIPQCGHLQHEERPQDVNAALLDFLGGWVD